MLRCLGDSIVRPITKGDSTDGNEPLCSFSSRVTVVCVCVGMHCNSVRSRRYMCGKLTYFPNTKAQI